MRDTWVSWVEMVGMEESRTTTLWPRSLDGSEQEVAAESSRMAKPIILEKFTTGYERMVVNHLEGDGLDQSIGNTRIDVRKALTRRVKPSQPEFV